MPSYNQNSEFLSATSTEGIVLQFINDFIGYDSERDTQFLLTSSVKYLQSHISWQNKILKLVGWGCYGLYVSSMNIHRWYQILCICRDLHKPIPIRAFKADLPQIKNLIQRYESNYGIQSE